MKNHRKCLLCKKCVHPPQPDSESAPPPIFNGSLRKLGFWFSSAGPKLLDPLLVLLQVGCRHGFGDFPQSGLKVLHGGWHVHFVPGKVPDLLWGETLDSPPHGHQRSVSATSAEQRPQLEKRFIGSSCDPPVDPSIDAFSCTDPLSGCSGGPHQWVSTGLASRLTIAYRQVSTKAKKTFQILLTKSFSFSWEPTL